MGDNETLMYKIYLFGSPRIYKNGEMVQISRRKSLAIFAYLSITNKPHNRDEMATLLYPGNDQSSARGNLRRDIFELKSSLNDDLLLLEGEQISLISPEQIWVDVNEFLGHVNTIRQHHQSLQGNKNNSACTDCIERITQAIELYSADFMSGFTIAGSRQFEDWQFFQSENLRQALSDIIQQLIQWHSERGEFEPAIAYGRRWLALDPLNEPAQRQMMRLYAASGQQTAALRQFSEFKHLLKAELGSTPDEETNSLYEAILNHQIISNIPIVSGRSTQLPGRNLPNLPPNNLPLPDESLIGRTRELEMIVQKLRDDPDCRMLTLVGPGGIGKTRLAVESAFRLAEAVTCPFCEGIFYISLATLSSPDAIILAIADVLKLPLLPDPNQRIQQVLNYLQPKRLLLLLDNFEHLIDSKNIQILVDVLTHAPQVKLLVTSQTRLNTHAEYVIQLQGLDVPTTSADNQDSSIETTIGGYSAIQFFLTRAKQINPEFVITNNNLESIVRICQLVEGMPLGIEMAVAWLDILTTAEIMDEIIQCLDFLTVNWPDRPNRHQSLRAVFDSSWKLLTEQERSLLMGLTVFQSNFSRQAAEAISGATLGSLMSLKNKSWIKVLNDGSYQIHDLLCQFANEKLQVDPNAWQQARKRYTAFYANFLDEQAENIKGPQQSTAFAAISNEFENIRLAWQWSIETGQVELAIERMLPALFRYAETNAKPFELTQLLDLALEWLERGASTPSSPRLESILLIARAAFNVFGFPLRMGYTVGNLNQEREIRRAWQLSGDVESMKTMGFWGRLLPFLYGLLVDTQEAIRCLQNLIPYMRQENRRWDLAHGLYLYGGVIILNYKHFTKTITTPKEAEPILAEALRIFSELRDKSESGYVLELFGMLYIFEGKHQKAIDQLQEALACSDEVGERVSNASILMNMADAYSRLGDSESSFQCFQLMSQRFLNVGHLSGAAQALSLESIHALRYSDIEHARQTRQQSLSLYQQDGNALGEAWATWEMGEINRVSGDLVQAKDWFEKARVLFEKYDTQSIAIFLERSQADIAAMNGDHIQVKIHFEQSAFHAQQMNHKWALSYALSGWGRAEVELGEIKSARQHFIQSIQNAREIDEYDLVLNALAGYTKVLTAANPDMAVELGTWIISHKLCWNETRKQVKSLLTTISLSPDRILEAKERSKHLDFNEAISRIINSTEE
jgi:predicted ATPase/DNA-binding SARP family transcriptional activator